MTNSPMMAGIYFFTLSPWSLTPIVNNAPRVMNVTRNLRQNAQAPSCSPKGTTFAAAAPERFSPRVQVANLTAEKSNALVRTAMQAMTITMPPIQIACQSSLPQNAGTVLPFSICRKISIMFYYFAKI